MFEITTRPPNSNIFQNNQQLQQQHQPELYQQHRRSQAMHQFRNSPRSSSLAAPNNSFDSARNISQFFFHNNLNNLAHQNLNNEIIYKLPVSSVNNGDSINQDRYVTRIITNNNNNNNNNNNDNKSKHLISSSLSYLNPNDNLTYSTDLTEIKSLNNGTILPVYYKNESTGQTSAISNTLPTVRNIPVINAISKPPSINKSKNLLPSLMNNNNNGSTTAVVTIANRNNSNGVKGFNSYTNLTNNLNEFNRTVKTTHIPITHSKNNESEYPLKLNSKQYSVIKGIRARQEMLSSGGLSANNINLYNSYSNFKNNNNNNNNNSIYNDDSKFIQSINDTSNNQKLAEMENITRQDTINSLESSSGSQNNFPANYSSRTNSTNTVKKSILVNRKKNSNPVNVNKKTVSFAT